MQETTVTANLSGEHAAALVEAATRAEAWFGEPFLHPDYDADAFWLHDLGLVVLDEAVDVPAYGKLPALDLLDQFKRRQARDKAWFTAVGYGLQRAFPTAAEWKEHDDKIRMVARPKLIQINTGFTGDGSLVLSNNARTGGTCFGDSGGPVISEDGYIVAVNSFVLNNNCNGAGFGYRVDTQLAHDFIFG